MKRPVISIVIPALNESKNVIKCLESIKQQNFKLPFEIIVVNGPSTDNTSELAKEMGAKVVNLKERGINIAWQKGSEKSKAEIIAFTEADCSVPENWLQRIYEEFENDRNLVGLTGEYRVRGRKILNLLINFIMPRLDYIYKSWTGYYPFRGTNFALIKKSLEECGGFNTQMMMYGDIELSTRMGKLGKIKHIHNLLVQTSNRNFSSVRKQIRFHLRGLHAVFVVAMLKKPHKLNFIHSQG